MERVRSLPAAAALLECLDDPPAVHLVGGAVRDLLLGEQPVDLDLVVATDAASFARRLGGELRVHDRFGTSTVRRDRFSYDIARARRETYARPGALPDVAPAGLAEDLLRRDFSVNAIAIALSGPLAGEISAAPCALENLRARRLCVLHDRSFVDDPTRLLRLVRYSTRLGFGIGASTRELVRSAVRDHLLSSVSTERVGTELRLLARERDPVAAMEQLGELGLDRGIDPGFALRDPALARRSLRLLSAHGRRTVVVLALAADRMPARELAGLLDRLAFGAGERDSILAAATRSQRLARSLAGVTTPSEIADAVAGADPELVAIAGARGTARAARAATDWLERLRHVGLEIDGADLLAAGVAEGPAIGRALRAALAAKRDGRSGGREEELARALEALEGG